MCFSRFWPNEAPAGRITPLYEEIDRAHEAASSLDPRAVGLRHDQTAVQIVPDDVREELEEQGLLDPYQGRPFYQRNDYLGWIGRAKRLETRRKRIEQMLQELDQGGLYGYGPPSQQQVLSPAGRRQRPQ